MVTTVDLTFCIVVTALVELLLLDLDMNHTICLPIAEFLSASTFGAVVRLVTAGC